MEGQTNTNRVNNTTERDLHNKVVDQVLNAVSFTSRQMSKGVPFRGKHKEIAVSISEDDQFQWISGLEDLNAEAVDNIINLQFSWTAGTEPVVDIMLESFANVGEYATIDYNAFRWAEAASVVAQKVSSAAWGLGVGDQPLGLRGIVDDGTNKATIGGQSRSTYNVLDATYTNSSGTMTLAKLGTLDTAVTQTANPGSRKNRIKVTTFTIRDLYEQLLNPQYTANYNVEGYPMISLRGNTKLPKSTGKAGFSFLAHRDVPIIADYDAYSGSFFDLDEDTFGWAGRDIVPENWKSRVEKVSLGGKFGSYETSTGLDELPVSDFHGWFYRKPVDMPNQLGLVSRFVVIGNFYVKEPRRNGQLHSITQI